MGEIRQSSGSSSSFQLRMGCSQNSIPKGAKFVNASTASSKLHPWLASMRRIIVSPMACLMLRMRCTSSFGFFPNFTLIMRTPSAANFVAVAAISSGVPMPMVKSLSKILLVPPKYWYNGCPALFAARSKSAISNALLAVKFLLIMASSSSSRLSISADDLFFQSAAKSLASSKQVDWVSPAIMGKAEHSPTPVSPSSVCIRIKRFCAYFMVPVAMVKGTIGMV